MNRRLSWIAALTGAVLAGSAGAQTDSTSVGRPLISTDGAVSVFDEIVPGEGIDGFWWEYLAQFDLERLLDEDRREEPLEPIRDAFGFELSIPDTITALRDSVKAVADSILAERIQVTGSFDPKITSTYNETKDRFTLKNEFSTTYPLVRDGQLSVSIANNNEFNESTGKIRDDRRVNTSFNYQYSPNIVSSFSVNWSDDFQERNGITDSQSDNVALSGQIKGDRDVGVFGKLETSTGLSFNRRNYKTSRTDGENSQLAPDWKVKLIRGYEGGSASIDYTGNFGSSKREERRLFSLTDSLGNQIDSTIVDESDETNFSNRLDLGASYILRPGSDLRFQGRTNRDQFQYLSQAAGFLGQQETRTREAQSAGLTLTSKWNDDLEVRAKADYRVDETGFELETLKTRRNTTRLANVDITYHAWDGNRWIFKMETSKERRDYQTSQAGDVAKQEGSIDFRQEVTENVDFEAAYYVTLDRFEFDDKEANRGDRDLRSQRGTFTVRYNPFTSVTSAVKMELRQNEIINVLPPASGDNNTDHGFLTNPNYTWRIGKASFRGDFTADARYKVQDFDENDNTLNRRFSFRQSWQHAFTERLSTETQYRWELSDQGSYNRSTLDGKRRFQRSRETRRSTVELKVLYTLFPGVRTRVEYRRDRDEQFRVDSGEKTLLAELPRREFLYSVDLRRDLFRNVKLDLKFSQTFKDGVSVSALESNFYNIRAQIVYEPLKSRKKR